MICLRFLLVVSLLILPGKVWADYDAGVNAYVAKDYKQALQEFQPLALKGDPKSQYSLGWLYERGYGVPKDPAQAYSWYVLAGQGGHAKAQARINGLKAVLQPEQVLRAEQEAKAFSPGTGMPGYPLAVTDAKSMSKPVPAFEQGAALQTEPVIVSSELVAQSAPPAPQAPKAPDPPPKAFQTPEITDFPNAEPADRRTAIEISGTLPKQQVMMASRLWDTPVEEEDGKKYVLKEKGGERFSGLLLFMDKKDAPIKTIWPFVNGQPRGVRYDFKQHSDSWRLEKSRTYF